MEEKDARNGTFFQGEGGVGEKSDLKQGSWSGGKVSVEGRLLLLGGQHARGPLTPGKRLGTRRKEKGEDLI